MSSQAMIIAQSLTQHEKDLLLGTPEGWGSWMWDVGRGLVKKGLGTMGPGTIEFNTPLANQVRLALRNLK